MAQVFEVGGLGDVVRASEVPRAGSRRLVRLLPTPFGSRPAIWTSPHATMVSFDEGEPPERARQVVVLMSGPTREDPTAKPDTAVITIPEAAIEKFPMVPVEW